MKFGKFQERMSEIKRMPTSAAAFNLTEEAGEVAKEFKSQAVTGRLNREQVAEEMGDCLMALAVLAESLGLDLDEIAQDSLDKWKEKEQE